MVYITKYDLAPYKISTDQGQERFLIAKKQEYQSGLLIGQGLKAQQIQ